MTQLKKKHGLLDATLVPHVMIILNCTAVEGIPRMLRHRYTENYQDIPFSEISWKLNACTLQCVPGVPPRPSCKLELERLASWPFTWTGANTSINSVYMYKAINWQ